MYLIIRHEKALIHVWSSLEKLYLGSSRSLNSLEFFSEAFESNCAILSFEKICVTENASSTKHLPSSVVNL